MIGGNAKMEAEFSRKYQIINEVLNAVTHGIAALLSVSCFDLLMQRAQSTLDYVAFLIYGSSLFLLFFTSTLFHSLIFTKAKKIFQIFDHCSIYLLIAGTYTPFCLLIVQGFAGVLLLSVIWITAVIGIIYKCLTLSKVSQVSKVSTIIYNVMGWGIVIVLPKLYQNINLIGLILLVAGGLAYSIGSIFYSMKDKKFTHVIWHLFVMLGATLMFLAVYFGYVI
ncbi:hemolysin III family channel protein [Enterococcus ratti]|uniref:Hemolysin III family channel protein n=2 Tax=Enterococcus ratti TaxID=150033 RepID=A0A1L8WIE6_9ENTE|nr:hemolysin III family channel protein [Enterococcus ratti]